MGHVFAENARLRTRRSHLLSTTVLFASWLSACGVAGAQDTPPPSSPPAPATSTPSNAPPPSTTTPQSPAATTPAPTPPAASNPKLPPVTIESPPTRQRPAGRTPTNEVVREKPQAPRAPANPPPAAVSRPGPTPRVTQRPTPTQAPTAAAAPINQSLFGGLIPAGAISASFVPQVAPGVPGPNLNAIATSATRLDLPLLQTPASVDVITAQTIQDQGYRTNVEAAAGAVGVLAFSPGGAQGGFSMRGFSSDAINHLYNGINIGIQDLTGRTQDTFSFDRIEFLKGASAIESGVGSIGGSVNYVTKQPFSGPVRNETFVSADSFRGMRTGFDSGGSTSIAGLDYRVVAAYTNNIGFIDDTRKQLGTLTARWNYQNSDIMRTWVAFEYYNDQGNYYWGTPVTPIGYSGPYSKGGVVGGSFSQAAGSSVLGPITIDSRTLTTNYNSLDNHDGAKQYWARTGFDLEITPELLLKQQVYAYKAQRTFFDDEFFNFNSASGLVDRFSFYVSHDQNLVGDVTNLIWDSKIFGLPNKFAAEVAASRNFLRFSQQANFTSTSTSVSLVDPARGYFGPLVTAPATTELDWVSQSFEDRLKITPTLALIGGVRIDEMRITNNAWNTTGALLSGDPVSKAWFPVSYRGAATWEPIEKMVFYGLYGTSYDPATAPIQLAGFQARGGLPLTLTSSVIKEVGVKQSLLNDRAEWTFAAFDLDRRNVIEVINSGPPPTFGIAGDIESKGVELSAAIRPVDGLKLWGNIAYTHARFGSNILSDATGGPALTVIGNAPPNVAPIIANAGAAYRFEPRVWPTFVPVEIGTSVRHVDQRYITPYNDVYMDQYTVFDAYMFIDFERPWWAPSVERTRLSFWARNLTNKIYADFADPGYQQQIYLGAPRSFEGAISFKF
jgi:iron complex outermembrane recepter protein